MVYRNCDNEQGNNNSILVAICVLVTIAVITFVAVLVYDMHSTSKADITTQPQQPAQQQPQQPAQRQQLTSKNNSIYGNREYIVGKEMPAGEYIVTQTGDRFAHVTVKNTSNPNEYGKLILVTGKKYVTLSNGQYVEFENCTATVAK